MEPCFFIASPPRADEGDSMSESHAPAPTGLRALAPWAALYLGLGAAGVTFLGDLGAATLLNALVASLYAHAGLAALAHREEGLQSSWRFMGAGFLLCALAQAYPVVAVLLRGALPPFPGPHDWSALGALPLFAAGLLLRPHPESTPRAKLRMGLDAAGVGLAVLFLAWVIVLGPLVQAASVPPKVKLAILGFLGGDAAILALIFMAGAPRLRGPLAWLALGTGIWILQVFLVVPLSLAGRYTMGHAVDLGVLLAGLFVLQGARCPEAPAATDPRPPAWSLLGPILPAGLCMALLAAMALLAPQRLDRPMVLLGALLGVLALWREFLALRDFQHLSRELDHRVVERTEALQEAQDTLVRTERMTTLAALGAGMAHDLKNLVGVVKNYALLMDLDLKEGRPLNPEDLESIRMGAEQAGDLAHRLMAFGKEEEPPDERFDLSAPLDRLIPLLRATLPAPLVLRYLRCEEPLPMLGNPQRVEQVVVNLVLNAKDAIHGSGSITVSLGREEDPPAARIAVEDTGHGMSPDVLARVFDPFFTTKSGSGTGLGLASVRGTLHEFGGRIEVESREGEGTTFVIHLPLAVTKS